MPSENEDPDQRYEDDLRALGNTAIGANPLTATISGAALCTSPAVTLDLPPFTHFRLNVMWIDDHCLRRLATLVKPGPSFDQSHSWSKNWNRFRGAPITMPAPRCGRWQGPSG